jgi:hypothetical protein
MPHSNLLKRPIRPPFVSLADLGSLYETHRRWSNRPTLDDVMTAINKGIAKLGNFFIVVDALDELCEESRAREFFKAIQYIPSMTSSTRYLLRNFFHRAGVSGRNTPHHVSPR